MERVVPPSLSTVSDHSFDRHAFWSGFREMIPFAIPGIPFGFVLGVAIADSGLDRFVAWLSSPLIFAGLFPSALWL